MFFECREYNKLCKLQDLHLFGNLLGNIDINCLAHLPSYSPNYMQERACLLGRFRKVQPEVSFINYEKFTITH
jgi:hypothetical protein